jgi:hypothetical protein
MYQGKVFMYPCAGLDIPDIVQTFGTHFDTFLFVDIHYNFRQLVIPVVPGWSEVEGTRRLKGNASDTVRIVQNDTQHYREVEPAWLTVDLQAQSTGRVVQICLRRGFGQYALHELNPGSLAMFLHRGDSTGEGGSNTWFLANLRMRHLPLSMLMNAIKSKLAYPALIGSDGSNTQIRNLREAARGDDGVEQFRSHALVWERDMTLTRPKDSRRTVIWRVSPDM